MLQEYLDILTIEVPVMELEVLIEAARRNFYSLRYSSDVTLSNERMCVNFLRHCGTKYERELRKLAGKTGKGDAYYEIKEKVLDEIAFTYEWLAEECHRQQQEMDRKRRESY